MITKNKLITTILLSTGAITAIAAINKYITLIATSKLQLETKHPQCYHWRLGDIYYTKQGSGKPLLLIHDLHPASSGYQWTQVIPFLSKHYTVYTIDLLGCGRSEKPNLTYTNYLYVQLICDFIKSEIGHKTDVIAVGNSGNFTVMACNHAPELFDQIMLVNPDSVSSCSQIPGKYSKCYKHLLDLPVIGTLLYNMTVSKEALRETFRKKYFSNPYCVKEAQIDSYYEAAHLGFSPKSTYSSVHCKYTKCNIVNALKKINNSIYLVGGADLHCNSDLFLDYVLLNPSIEYTTIADTKYLPHLERPSAFLTAVYTYFSPKI